MPAARVGPRRGGARRIGGRRDPRHRGALRSPAWTASLTAALGSPVQLAEATGGSGLGAALLGWRALGAFDSLTAAAAVLPAGRTVLPDSDAVRRLAALRPLADRAHHALHDIAVELGGLVEQWG